MIGTTGDPDTPYRDAVALAGRLDNARLLTFRAEGHAAFDRSECVAAAVTSYLVDLTLPRRKRRAPTRSSPHRRPQHTEPALARTPCRKVWTRTSNPSPCDERCDDYVLFQLQDRTFDACLVKQSSRAYRRGRCGLTPTPMKAVFVAVQAPGRLTKRLNGRVSRVTGRRLCGTIAAVGWRSVLGSK